MKKKGTTKKEKSDKSHEQSDFSPHIIQKKKRQCTVSRHCKQRFPLFQINFSVLNDH